MSAPEPYKLRSFAFRREREAAWHELQELVERVERGGLKALDADELHRLPTLYRGVLSSLSVARSISLDLNVVQYLEGLAGRAYLAVYNQRRSFFDSAVAFFVDGFPRLLWSMRRALLLSAAVMILGAVCGFALTWQDSDRFYSFVAEEMAGDRTPAASHATLVDSLYDTEEDFGTALAAFASYLFTHNTKIGLACFALGFAAGVPVLLLLFMNGLLLGAFATVYHRQELGVDFWGWVLPHGVTELLAVIVCGAAGLALGHALVWPGRHSRFDNLMRRGRQAASVVIGAMLMFFVAALIEGFFRQLVHNLAWRYTVIALTATFWTLYIARGRRLPALDGEAAP